MLIRCPKCSAGYDFPVEQLPAEGLRAKCARCSFVMLVKPDAGALDPETMQPRVAFKPRAGGEEVTTVSKHREEKAVEAGPSIVVDIGQFGPDEDDSAAPAAPAAPTVDPKSAFSPLALSAAPPTANPAQTQAILAVLDSEPIDLTDMEIVVRPPGLWRLAVGLLFVSFAIAFVFVWARNDWGPIWEDPVASAKAAFEVKERVTPTSKPAPIKVEVDEAKGQLVIQDLKTRSVTRGGQQGLWVQGIVHNDSNRAHKAISLEISLAESAEGPSVAQRVVPCCELLAEAEILQLPTQPEHAHFSEKTDWEHATRLKPGEEAPFGVMFLGAQKNLTPRAKVRFFEMESPSAATAGDEPSAQHDAASAPQPPEAQPDSAAPTPTAPAEP